MTQVACRRCAVGVDIHTAAQTHGYCRECAPALPGMAADVNAQIEAAEEHSGKELTDKLREPGKDISRKAGEMERTSPLFFGTGANPGLFGLILLAGLMVASATGCGSMRQPIHTTCCHPIQVPAIHR